MLVGLEGIEPSSYRLRAECNCRYTTDPEFGGCGRIRTYSAEAPVLQTGRTLLLPRTTLAPREGFEPPTLALTARRSATELPRKNSRVPVAGWTIAPWTHEECAHPFGKE